MDEMTGRERVLAAFARRPVDRTPWVPFVGCHGAALIGMPASEYLKSAEAVERGAAEAVRRYAPDGLPVLFDLQVEAEALGCGLVWADQNPPAVSTHPLSQGQKLEDMRLEALGAGRPAMAFEAARRLRRAHPDLALYGLVTGPFTLAMHLYGTDLFMDMLERGDEVKRLLAFCRDAAWRMTEGYLGAGCDVAALVDPMTSQISPDLFRAFVSEPASDLFGRIRAAGRKSAFFVCGHAQQNIEAMADCGPDNVSIDENIPLDFVREACRARGLSFGGNLQLTVVLLNGGPEDAERNAAECLEAGGPEGFVLSPGCDLPYATPPANLEAVARVVRDPYRREVARALRAPEDGAAPLDMTDYGQSGKVVVDIITLDSEACAPCQYMVEAVRRVAPQFEGLVEWREHKIKHPDAVAFMSSLMVRNIPTICIDGKITFVSRIPPRDELVAAIERRIVEKLHATIRKRRGELVLLGRTPDELQALRAEAARAARELGSDVPVTEVSDEKAIAAYGIVRTPAVVSVHAKVRAEGRVPHAAALKEWLKEIA